MARIYDEYKEKMVPELMSRLSYRNRREVPRMEKIVLNIGIGDANREKTLVDEAVAQVAAISGQRPIVTRAKKSIAGFKIRKGMQVGCKATLRGRRMYEFFDRFVNVATPRIRDFRGFTPLFDGRGNFSVGLSEIIIFPEIDLDKMKHALGMNITIVTTAKTDGEARELLTLLGVPFRGEETSQ